MAYLSSWKWLNKLGPGFPMQGSNIKVLGTPDNFYSVLIDKAKTAKRRVCLASLYIGNGQLEKNLLAALQSNLEANRDLKVKVLLDYARGSRGAISSRTVLLPLVRTSETCQVYLYHTPTLRGMLKKCLPQKWNELIGLQHMKIYIFDNSLVITGANLSHDYFTNRQDRYVIVENCEDLANFYDGLISEVSSFSLKVNKEDQVTTSPLWKIHPIHGDQNEFIKKARSTITAYYDHYKSSNNIRLTSFLNKCSSEEKSTAVQDPHEKQTTPPPPVSPDSTENLNSSADTWIFPLIQMGPLNIELDNIATCRILEESPEYSTIKLATGYFNLTHEYIDKIIVKSKANFDILMAHPKANGFLGARGVAGGIPAAYTQLAKVFHERVKRTNQQRRIAMWEYVRPNWTFHSKGLWFYPPQSKLPFVTLIGSPNFGHRSVYRDLETQLYIITECKSLQQQFHEEQKKLFEDSVCFGDQALAKTDRLVPLWVKVVITFFRNFF